MTISESIWISLFGTALIVAVLALLMLMIHIMSFVLKKSGKASDSAEKTAPPQYAEVGLGDLKLINVDERTAAMLMAIVADKMQLPVNTLKFISIREIGEE